jgi:hypothetical protein
MARLVFEMNVSLDGYTNHEALGPPDPVLFRYFIELTRSTASLPLWGSGTPRAD